jgi:vacuolar-type H+-ATPase subunit B/Vma2
MTSLWGTPIFYHCRDHLNLRVSDVHFLKSTSNFEKVVLGEARCRKDHFNISLSSFDTFSQRSRAREVLRALRGPET